MKRTTLAVAALATIWTLSPATTSGQGGPPSGSDSYDRLPPGAGREVLVKACVTCHDPQRAASLRLTREGWEGVVQSMLLRGMKATEEEQAVILEYLSTHLLGEAPRPININTAAQIDFESVLSLLRSEARAVIEYREKNGPFKEITDLRKVSGLDYKKVEQGKDRIVAFVPGSR